MSLILETRDLQKSFGAVTAAKAISVKVPRGGRLGLIGNNGAGKTTFVNIVTGYLRPDAGTVMLDGVDITGRLPRLVNRHGVSRSFQIPQLFLTLSLDENLLVALGAARYRRLPFWRPALSDDLAGTIDDVLERFALRRYRDHRVSTLPGGVRKLVDIAMAVARRPKLLLLDEPTSGVATEEKFPLMDVVMQALAGSDATVLFVEHDMDIVRRYADRVLAFYDGRIIADGTPGEVLSAADVKQLVTGTLR